MVLTVALGWLTVVGTMLASRSAEVACVALAGVVYLCVHGRRQGWRWSGLWLRLVQAQGTLQQQVSNLSDRIDSPHAGSYPDPEAQAWARGADGERRTAELLRGLGRDWVVFHDAAIPGARANVDHVAVGPTGVWVIDSKAWSPPVGVSEDARLTHRGQDLVAELSTTQWEALHVARLLGTSTRAVVCIHDAALPGQVTESLLVDEVPPSAVPADPFRITGQVTVVAPGALTATLQNEEHLPVQELREIRAKARHLLRPHGQVQPNVPTARIAYHADRTLVTTIDGVWLIDRGAPAETAPSGSSPTTEPAGSADASA
jgi:hypothetical protein